MVPHTDAHDRKAAFNFVMEGGGKVVWAESNAVGYQRLPTTGIDYPFESITKTLDSWDGQDAIVKLDTIHYTECGDTRYVLSFRLSVPLTFAEVVNRVTTYKEEE